MTAVMEIRTAPHVHSGRSVEKIMFNVVCALLPICAYAVWIFGISALALIATTTASCVLLEHFWSRTAGDYSAAITGMLLGLTLPPGLPLWMGVVGSFIAIAPAKLIFGGLGHNVFNPALVGRAFLQAAFPTAITTYTPARMAHRFSQFIPATLTAPFLKAAPVHIDGFSGATPLMLQKFEHVGTNTWSLFSGEHAGSSGETCAWLILLCGLYLIVRKMMDWRIPAAMLLGALLTGGAYHWSNAARYPGSLVVLFSGGLMLGAMFMATDPVASPVTPRGMWIYGLLMGLVTVVIRYEGGLPEGVMYSILLGNALSPLIDNVTQPRTYGERTKAAA